MYFDLNTLDRDTYAVARPKWRSAYKALAAEIKTTKIEAKEMMKSGGYAGGQQSWLIGAAQQATGMLTDLKEAKAKLKLVLNEVDRAA